MNHRELKPKGSALIPFIVFVLFYLGTGILVKDFYAIPSPISVIMGIIVAFIMFKGSIDSKFNTFVKGCGDENIIIMCLIYILAGAFSTVSNSMGGVQSTVNFGLSFIPARFITAGIFVIAAFVSLSTGTSVGTITTICPIAIGLADKAGLNLALVLGALVGGAMFGDNLSVISDTTIAATRTQNCEMKDKFRMNFKIALPAAILTFILLLVFAKPVASPATGPYDYSFLKILPYLVVLVTALAGMNVFVVLTGGIILSGLIGIFTGSFNLLELSKNIYTGFTGMFEIFLLSMLTGGLAYMVTKEGGIDWIIQKGRSFMKGEKSAEVGISAVVALLDAAVANNTVAIIIAGPVAKEISNEYKIDPRRSASLLDTLSCVMQGLIPYGAQVLIAAGSSNGKVSPFDIMPFFWYQFLLAVFAILSIYTGFSNAKDKWNYEYDMSETKVAELRAAGQLVEKTE